MFVAPSRLLTSLILAAVSFTSMVLQGQQPAASIPGELDETDPLRYAVVYARKSNNQSALSEIAVHYAELGDFEQALRINESATAEDCAPEHSGRSHSNTGSKVK